MSLTSHVNKICSPCAELTFRKDKIQWECQNGGVLWTDSAAAGYGGNVSIPNGFCGSGFSSLNAAFIVSLLVDLGFQVSFLGPLSGHMVAQPCFLSSLVSLVLSRGPYTDALPGILLYFGNSYTCTSWFGDSRRGWSITRICKAHFMEVGSSSFSVARKNFCTCGRARRVLRFTDRRCFDYTLPVERTFVGHHGLCYGHAWIVIFALRLTVSFISYLHRILQSLVALLQPARSAPNYWRSCCSEQSLLPIPTRTMASLTQRFHFLSLAFVRLL